MIVFAGDRLPFSTLSEDSAALLLVHDPGVRRARLEVGLVAADDQVSQVFAAVLDATVAAGDPILEREIEIVDVALPPDEKRIPLGGILGRRFADDHALFHRPKPRLPFPAVERRAIEDWHVSGIVGSDDDRPVEHGQHGQRGHQDLGSHDAHDANDAHADTADMAGMTGTAD